MAKQSGLQDILPLAPLQEGLLFHSVYDEAGPDVYLVQQAIDLEETWTRRRWPPPAGPCCGVTPICARRSATRG